MVKNETGKNVARHVTVKKGESSRGYTEILTGLNKGDKVITEGFQDLNDGDIVSF